MARPSAKRELTVWMNGERVGTWTTHRGRPDEFSYTPEWQQSEGARPISLSMPLRPTPFQGETVAAYFDNLLPDSPRLRERIHRRFGTASSDNFDLLAEIGRDCVGAIQLLPPNAPAPDIETIEGRALSAAKVEAFLDGMLNATGGRYPDDNDFRISLAGAQEKTALLRQGTHWRMPLGTTPTTHILKLPIGGGGGGIDLSTSVENEWFCAQILKAYGVPVADCWIEQFGERTVLVVERFDRRRSSDKKWIVRLPQEDCCQALGLPSARKYESDGGPGIRRIMDLLLGSSRAEEDRRDFLKTQMLFWMLCAIDGHAKNFSVFLEARGGYRLTPRYDVLSALPVLGTTRGKLQPKKVKMAMAVQGKARHYLWHTIQARHWEETAHRCGMSAAYPALKDELISMTPNIVRIVANALPRGFPESIAVPILKGLEHHAELLSKR